MGSKRSKKSLTTALKLISLILQHPKNNILAIRRYFVDHKKSTFPSLCWAISKIFTDPHTNQDHSHTYFSISSPKSKDLYIIYKPTGQQIIFHSLDDNQRVNSLSAFKGNLNISWIEEAYEIESIEAFDTLTSSITQADSPYKRFYLTFNPFLETSWLKTRFFDLSQEEKTSQSIFTKITTFRDNEFLGKDDLLTFQNLQINNPKLFEIIGNANWGAAEGVIFPNFIVRAFSSHNMDILVQKSSLPYRHMSAYERENLIYRQNPRFVDHYGLDYGFSNHPATFVRVTEDRRSKILYCHCPYFYETNLSNIQLSDKIRETGKSKCRIFSDRSEPKTNSELYTLGIKNIKKQTYKTIEEGIKRMLNYKIVIQNTPHSKPAIQEFTNYRYYYDPRLDQLTRKIAPSADHYIDAVRYSLCDVLRMDLTGFLYV